jgi:hypothetical protein
MNPGKWGLGAGLGMAVGLVVACVMTYLDWSQNPGNLFYNQGATNWAIIAETAGSWFFPVAALAIPVTWILIYIHSRMN